MRRSYPPHKAKYYFFLRNFLLKRAIFMDQFSFKFIKIYGFIAIAGYDKLAFMKLKNISETEFEQYKDEFYRFALPWLDRYNNSYVYLDENGNFVR